jgi:hypothetical protein
VTVGRRRQADHRGVQVLGAGRTGNEAVFEVLNIVDDHSRLCIASRAFVSTRSPDSDHGSQFTS